MRKFLITLSVTAVLFVMLFLVRTGAPSAPGMNCYVNHRDLPEGTVFLELLLPETYFSGNYTELNTEQCTENGVGSDAQIVKGVFDGYTSYTYHYNASSSLSQLSKCEITALDDENNYYEAVFWQGINHNDIKTGGNLKFAFVDAYGNVIKLTNNIKVNPLLTVESFKIDSENVTVNYRGIKFEVFVIAFVLSVSIEAVAFAVIGKRKSSDFAHTGELG